MVQHRVTCPVGCEHTFGFARGPDRSQSRQEPCHAATEAAPSVWLRFLVPSVADLIFIILLIAMTGGILAPRLLGDASIGWHIRNGELMLHAHSITCADPFSVTMNGAPWYAWEWLYDIVIAGIHHWSGLNGVVFFTALIIAATFALTLRLSLQRGADLPVTVVLLALSLGASMIHLLAPAACAELAVHCYLVSSPGHVRRFHRSKPEPPVMVAARPDVVLGKPAWRICCRLCAARAISDE